MTIRKTLFWCHLAVGVSAGIVILIMSLTGVLLTYQPQILRYIDRDVRLVESPGDISTRLTPAALFEKVTAERPNVKLLGLTLQSDPREAAAFQTEGPTGPGSSPTLYVNPYTGEIRGQGSTTARTFFRVTAEWHRYLALAGDERPTGKLITGISNVGFLGLAISGIYLWWPKSLSVRNLKVITMFRWSSDGRARDWNWHNTTGFWCSLILVVLTATAMVISFPWANNLVYRITGSEIPRPAAPPSTPAPPTAGSPAGGSNPPSAPSAGGQLKVPENLDGLWRQAEAQVPEWRSIAFRIPQREDAPAVFAISNGEAWDLTARSTLTLNPETAAVVTYEGYMDQSVGRRVRTWMRFLHTGEALGPIGQTIAGLASAGGVLLVWTGISLAFRRFFAWLRRRAAQPNAAISPVKAES
jgi:uncharacterized iron-regulated membrane protein